MYRPSVKEVDDLIEKLERLRTQKEECKNIPFPVSANVLDFDSLSREEIRSLPEEKLLEYLQEPERPIRGSGLSGKGMLDDKEWRQIRRRQRAFDKLKSDFWSENIRPFIDEIEVELSPWWPYLSQSKSDTLRNRDRIERAIKSPESERLSWLIHEFKKIKKIIETEQTMLGTVSTPIDAAKGGGVHANERGPAKRSWVQVDLDNAIREYQAQRAQSYDALVKGVNRNETAAITNARKVFGRNAIAHALGVKSAAMVTKSPAWRAIAAELHLLRNIPGERRIDKNRRIGLDIAVEQAAGGVDDAACDPKERKETIRLIRKTMRQEDADEMIETLETDGIDDEKAREIVELYLDQQKDQKRQKINQSP